MALWVIIFSSIWLLTEESALNSTYRLELYVALIGAGIVVLSLYRSPVNRVVATFTFVILFTAMWAFGGGDFGGVFIWFGNEAFRSWNSSATTNRSIVYLAVIVALGGVGTALAFLSWYYTERLDAETIKLQRRLDFLYELPGIESAAKDISSRRFQEFLANWKAFLDHVSSVDKNNAEALLHCVPVSVDTYNVHIGCVTASELKNLVDVRRRGRNTLPSRSEEIEKNLQEFFNSPHYRLVVEQIDKHRFDEAYRELHGGGKDGLVSTADTPSKE